MNKRNLGVLLSVVLMVSFGSCKKSTTPGEKSAAAPTARGVSPASPAAAGGLTAKASLEKAREKARAWQSDAVLIGVNSMEATKEGKVIPGRVAMGWTYAFWSRTAKKQLALSFNGSEFSTSEQPESSLTTAIEDFVDSDQVMAEAIKNGLAPTEGNSHYLGLLAGSCPKGVTDSLCWKIKGGGGGGEPYYLVSGNTGKFVGTSPW